MIVKDHEVAYEVLNPMDSNGYLLCRNCGGYYHLKNNETIEDFESCECGGLLEFYERLPKMLPKSPMEKYNEAELEIYDDYHEIEQLLTLLKNKSEKRNALIKDLSNRIRIQEGLLNEIKENRWNLWDILDQRNLQNDIKNQKRLLDDIAENEERLMFVIKEQRQRARSSDNITISYLKRFGTRGFLILEFVVITMLVFLLLI